MLLFRRIFDFQKSSVARLEQRHNHRSAPGKEFPLHARLHLGAEFWPGRVLDISAQGIGLLVERDAGLSAGQTGRLHLELDQYELDLDARLAHAEPHADGWHYGLTFDFSDFAVRKTYLQLLQPISIGCSLQPMAPSPAAAREQPPPLATFRGESDSELSIWRAPPAMTPHRFEFLLPDYVIHAASPGKRLEVSLRPRRDQPDLNQGPGPTPDLSDDAKADIRQLFRWIAPNLGQSIPVEIRLFLQSFAR